MYLTASRDGKKSPVPAPLKYQVYTWRKEMKVGFFEAMITPFEVILNDIEMGSLEQEYGQKHEQPSTNKKGLKNGTTR